MLKFGQSLTDTLYSLCLYVLYSCLIFAGNHEVVLPKGFRYLTPDEERRFSVNCENDKTFVSEYDSEKNIFVQSTKKILTENQQEEVSCTNPSNCYF